TARMPRMMKHPLRLRRSSGEFGSCGIWPPAARRTTVTPVPRVSPLLRPFGTAGGEGLRRPARVLLSALGVVALRVAAGFGLGGALHELALGVLARGSGKRRRRAGEQAERSESDHQFLHAFLPLALGEANGNTAWSKATWRKDYNVG